MTIEASFRSKREAGRALLVPYITGGLGAWRETIEEIAAAGADAIEVGERLGAVLPQCWQDAALV